MVRCLYMRILSKAAAGYEDKAIVEGLSASSAPLAHFH